MSGAWNALSNRLARFGAVLGRKQSATNLIVHDPAESRPHDLDNPYFDQNIQGRIGATIAHATRKEPRREDTR